MGANIPDTCLFCNQRKDVQFMEDVRASRWRVDCPWCNSYCITEEAIDEVKRKYSDKGHVFGAYNLIQNFKRKDSYLLEYLTGPSKEMKPNISVLEEVIKWWPDYLRDQLDFVLLNISQKIGDIFFNC